nr:MAG TPA: hypothetical protein [Caudoviricetes sp.]
MVICKTNKVYCSHTSSDIRYIFLNLCLTIKQKYDTLCMRGGRHCERRYTPRKKRRPQGRSRKATHRGGQEAGATQPRHPSVAG